MSVLSRRGFLSGIIAACAAPAIITSGVLMPVKSLVVPKGPNLLLTPSMVTREAFKILDQRLNFISLINRHYDDALFAHVGDRNGSTLKIRLPQSYLVRA